MSATSPHRPDQAAVLLDEWVDARRQIAVLEARSASLLADRLELMDADVSEMPLHRGAIERSMVAEYTAAGRMAKGSVEHAFADARLLREVFPAVWESFESGSITAAHAREIVRAGFPVQQAVDEGTIAPHMLGLYEAAAVEFAEVEAPARTRAHVRELAAALAPQTVTERHRAALDEQYVSVIPREDGMALLIALMPAERAEAIMDRLTGMAREIKEHPTVSLRSDDPVLLDDGTEASTAVFGTADTCTTDPFHPGGPAVQDVWVPFDPFEDPEVVAAHERALLTEPEPIQIPDDPRSLDRIRAELLTDQLLTAVPSDILGDALGKITAHVQVTIAATTLIGTDDRPAQLDGGGTVPAAAARHLAGLATSWTRLFLGADGFVTRTDTYVPTAGMRRYLRARDQHCRFPGCRMPVHRGDTDHTHDHALGGPTSITNLAHLCKTHHALKHPDIPDQHRWRASQGVDGDLEWTSPTGRLHHDKAPRRIMFMPSGPAVPAASAAPF